MPTLALRARNAAVRLRAPAFALVLEWMAAVALVISLGSPSAVPSDHADHGGPMGHEDAHDDERCGQELAHGAAARPGYLVPESLNLERAGVFYLTFDDGPNRVYTPRVLRVLREHKAPATFFVTGRRIAGNEEILREMARDGHIIASHQWRHEIASRDKFEEWIPAERDLIDDVVGARQPRYFRYPFGFGSSEKEGLLREFGYTDGGIGWDIDSLDWCYAGGGGTCDRARPHHREDYVGHVMALARYYRGGVILFHDIQWITVRNLDRILTLMEREGFRFAALPREGR